MRVGIDFDGVISNLCDLKARGARKLFGITIPEEIMHKHIILRKGLLTEKQYDELQHFIAKTEFGHTMRPVIGMQPSIKKLLREGYDIHVVTSRDGRALEIAREWLVKKELPINIIGVPRGESKVAVAKKHKIDIFVDDDLYKLEPLCGTVSHRLLFSWPYNDHVQESSFIKRVRTWQELYREIAILGMWHISGFPTLKAEHIPAPIHPNPL